MDVLYIHNNQQIKEFSLSFFFLFVCSDLLAVMSDDDIDEVYGGSTDDNGDEHDAYTPPHAAEATGTGTGELKVATSARATSGASSIPSPSPSASPSRSPSPSMSPGVVIGGGRSAVKPRFSAMTGRALLDSLISGEVSYLTVEGLSMSVDDDEDDDAADAADATDATDADDDGGMKEGGADGASATGASATDKESDVKDADEESTKEGEKSDATSVAKADAETDDATVDDGKEDDEDEVEEEADAEADVEDEMLIYETSEIKKSYSFADLMSHECHILPYCIEYLDLSNNVDFGFGLTNMVWLASVLRNHANLNAAYLKLGPTVNTLFDQFPMLKNSRRILIPKVVNPMNVARHLSYIDLTNNGLNDKCMFTLANALFESPFDSNLRSLRLAQNPLVSDKYTTLLFHAFAQKCPFLEMIDLSFCSGIADDTCNAVVTYFETFAHYYSLYHTDDDTSSSGGGKYKVRHCLHRIDLSNCSKISNRGVLKTNEIFSRELLRGYPLELIGSFNIDFGVVDFERDFYLDLRIRTVSSRKG